MKVFRNRDFASQIQQGKRQRLSHFDHIISNFHFDCCTAPLVRNGYASCAQVTVSCSKALSDAAVPFKYLSLDSNRQPPTSEEVSETSFLHLPAGRDSGRALILKVNSREMYMV
jgi:hypothetical protein